MSVCFSDELVNFLSFCVPLGEHVVDVLFPLKGFNFALILIISVATAEIKMLAKAAKETPSLGNVSFHIVGLPVCTVSVFGKKSDAVCGFLAYFCAVLRFSDPPYAPLILDQETKNKIVGQVDYSPF